MEAPLQKPPSILILLTTFLVLTNVPTSFCEDDLQFLNCTQSLTCGILIDVKYPFWGVNRADYCGLPGLQLECQEDVPKLTMESITYRILNVNPSERSLTVARDDYWRTLCPASYKNTTINSILFSYAPGLLNLTLYYGCTRSSSITGILGPVQCDIDDDNSISVFVLQQDAGISPQVGGCSESVIVTVFQDSFSNTEDNLEVNASRIGDVIDAGFGLRWSVNNNECDTCVESGGACGFDPSNGQFNCFCREGPESSSCSSASPPSPSGKKGSRVSLSIGLAIAGAAIVGMLLVFGFFHVQRKRKRLAQQSNSKDLSTPPSSKGIVTSTTNLSQSVPSYFSSKSNLGNGGSTYFGVQVFSYTELEEATDNFDTSRELGDGGFGTVYYGILKDGREVAVKRLYESNFKRVEQFMNEIEILTRLRHSNLVTLYGCTSRHSRELLLVYEYIPNGTVADHLHGKQAKSGLLTWPLRLSIATKTAEALAYLHASDIIHRDVKTNNILLDNYFHVKVADFGLSRLFPNHVTHISTAPQGTPGYVDPEYYQCYQLTDKSDVYSFGVVLIELISSLEAVDTSRHRQDINLANMAINKIQNHELHELVDPCLGFEKDYSIRQMTTSVAELAFRCLQQERDMRPSMDEVLEVLRGIENEGFVAQAAEVVDIKADDVVLLKSIPPPLSPDSVVDVKWQMDVLRRTA